MSGGAPQRRDDAGFTLPELIISMTILSFIMGALVFALVFALRSSSTTVERVTAGGNQTLAAWFPSDVMGMQPGTASTAADAVTPCAGETGDLKVLLPRVNDPASAVSYRTVAAGDGYQLWRFVCTNGALRHNVVVQGIVDPALVVAGLPVAGGPDRITLTVVMGHKEPSTLTVSGSPRSSDEPIPCSLVAASPLTVVITAGGQLVADTTMAVTTTGPCAGALALRLPVTATTDVTVPLAGADDAWTAHVRPGDATWAATAPGAPRNAALLLDGKAIGSFPLDVVSQTCAVVSAAATPDVGATVPAGAVTMEADGHLTRDLALTLVTSGPCPALQVTLATGGAPATVPLVQASATSWTLARAAATWSAGYQVGTVTSAGANAGTIGVLVAPGPCQLVNDPSRVLDTDSTGQVTGVVPLSLTTSGVCGRLVLSVPTGGAPDPLVIDPVPGGPNVWTATIRRCTASGTPPCFPTNPAGPTWLDGPHTATVTNTDPTGTTTLRGFRLTAREVCSMTANGPSTVVLANDALRTDTTFSVTTRGNCGVLTLSIDTGVAPGLANLALTGPGPTRTRVVRQADAQWTPGPHVVTVRTDATVLGTFTTTANASCAVVANSWSDTIGVSGANHVTGNQRITFTTSGPCGPTLTIRIDPPGGTGLQSLVVTSTGTAAGITSWQTADLNGAPWTRGGTAQVYVHDTTTPPFDGTNVAGFFLVTGQ